MGISYNPYNCVHKQYFNLCSQKWRFRMKRIKNHKGPFLILCLVVLATACLLVVAMQADEKKEPCYYSSLHYTGEGMRYWYEKDDGFMSITGIPYKELDCSKCHV